MGRTAKTFTDDEIARSEEVERLFDGTQAGMRSLLSTVRKTDWFTTMVLKVPLNEYGIDQPMLYVGIDPDEDESGVETSDVLDTMKSNGFPGVSYSYFSEDTPVGLAIVCSPSHVPNNEL